MSIRIQNVCLIRRRHLRVNACVAHTTETRRYINWRKINNLSLGAENCDSKLFRFSVFKMIEWMRRIEWISLEFTLDVRLASTISFSFDYLFHPKWKHCREAARWNEMGLCPLLMPVPGGMYFSVYTVSEVVPGCGRLMEIATGDEHDLWATRVNVQAPDIDVTLTTMPVDRMWDRVTTTWDMTIKNNE